jgi:hypothetical protein
MARRKQSDRKDLPSEPANYFREEDVSRFTNLQYFAYGGIAIFFAGAAAANGFFSTMWDLPSAPDEVANFVARVVLFIELVVLAVRWIIATLHELLMWVRWLKNPLSRQEMYAAILGLSIVLGLLLAFPHRILIIAGIMTVYLLINYWTQWLANEHFRRALHETKQMRLSNTKKRVLEVMEYFWLKRPQLARIVTMMFFSFIAFSLALAGTCQPDQQLRQRFQLIAYVILILIIFISEIVIAWWRRKLERGIEQATDSKE